MDVSARTSNSLYGPGDQKRWLDVSDRPGLPEEEYRSAWRRDYARLVHCPAFRRLQGKPQVYPWLESDFFRNRLTHSLEVAQIAKSIAIRLNNTHPFFECDAKEREARWINTDLVETVALAHDLGHPPFGHNGENALDDCMKLYGGFEGNAQTLRILCRLEKKEKADAARYEILADGSDARRGLNLTYRTLAGILKYDHEIPVRRRKKDGLEKGYYRSEREVVSDIKRHVVGRRRLDVPFRTIECTIMDLADDIAYSTYDLEDTLKAGFAKPLHIALADGDILDHIARKAKKTLGDAFNRTDVRRVLFSIFRDLMDNEVLSDDGIPIAERINACWRMAEFLASNGYLRTQFTAQLVTEFVQGTSMELNEDVLALSRAVIAGDQLEKVEVLKHFTFENIIMSPRVRIAEHRTYDIVRTIFEALADDDGHYLLPEDFRFAYEHGQSIHEKMRVVCDFVACMTDRYALEFYGRLCSEDPESIFKPV